MALLKKKERERLKILPTAAFTENDRRSQMKLPSPMDGAHAESINGFAVQTNGV